MPLGIAVYVLFISYKIFQWTLLKGMASYYPNLSLAIVSLWTKFYKQKSKAKNKDYNSILAANWTGWYIFHLKKKLRIILCAPNKFKQTIWSIIVKAFVD